MKNIKYSVVTILLACCIIIGAGCSKSEDSNATNPSTVAKPQLPATATPEQQAAAQAKMDAGKAQGEAYAKQMEERFKNK